MVFRSFWFQYYVFRRHVLFKASCLYMSIKDKYVFYYLIKPIHWLINKIFTGKLQEWHYCTCIHNRKRFIYNGLSNTPGKKRSFEQLLWKYLQNWQREVTTCRLQTLVLNDVKTLKMPSSSRRPDMSTLFNVPADCRFIMLF